jgi:uncharacterized repeat protein (TIGR04076 family)
LIDERIWRIVQKRFRYNDTQMKAFKNNPRNEAVLMKGEELAKIQFKATVVDAHGCNSRHKKGDVFYLDGHGNLIKAMNPDKICIYALSSLSTLVFAAHELIYAGIDPNEMKFNRVGCLVVGLNCGGWGKIVLELNVEKK